MRGAVTRAAPAAAIGLAVLMAAAVLASGPRLAEPTGGDLRHYHDFAARMTAGDVPYRDFRLEYPPGAIPVFLAPAPADDGYFRRFRLLALGLMAATVILVTIALAFSAAPAVQLYGSAAFVALAPLSLARELTFDRYDIWPTALLVGSLLALLVGRRRIAMATLGVASVAKVFPLVVLPVALLFPRGGRFDRARSDVAVFGAAVVVFVLPFLFLAPHGLASMAWTLVRRPLHIESLAGSLLLGADHLGIYRASDYLSFAGSWDLAGTLPKAAAVLLALTTAVSLTGVWRLFAVGPRRNEDVLLAAAAAVIAFVAFGKVFSPQYVIWIVALGPLVPWRVWPLSVACTGIVLVLTRIYYDRYEDVIAIDDASWFLTARNLVLCVLFMVLVREMWRRRRPSDADGAFFGPSTSS